jgi:CheY-like chemotaxis protein
LAAPVSELVQYSVLITARNSLIDYLRPLYPLFYVGVVGSHFLKWYRSMSMAEIHIVIVEDEPDILDVLSYSLKREGFQVTAALDGAEGLNLIQAKLPDLVLLDLMLPSMDGLDICRHLKNKERTRTIPVVMLTAKGEESDIVLGLGIGADDYVTKPFSPKELIARVKAVLRRFGPAAKPSAEKIIEVDQRNFACSTIWRATQVAFLLESNCWIRPLAMTSWLSIEILMYISALFVKRSTLVNYI